MATASSIPSGWYCTSCNRLTYMKTPDGMCSTCPNEPLFDLGSPSGLEGARTIEHEHAVARLRKAQGRAALMMLPWGVVFSVLWLSFEIYMEHRPHYFRESSAYLIAGILVFFGSTGLVRATHKFRVSEAERRKTPGGALSAKLAGHELDPDAEEQLARMATLERNS